MHRRLLPLAVVTGLLVLWGCRPDNPSEAEPAAESPRADLAPAPPPPAPPATSFREQRVVASDGAPFDHLGFSVTSGEGMVVAGARFADAPGVDAGAVYVFRQGSEGWTEEAKLVAGDAVEHDRFGNAVGLDGDTLVVGAHAHHELGRRTGSAYVFRRDPRGNSWKQEARLAVPGSARFGHAAEVSGDRVIVGAPGDLVDGRPAGAAYVYLRQGSSWKQEARLTADDAEAHDLFGVAVALSGDTAVVGAAADDEMGSMTGAVYVFRREGGRWRQEAKLLPEDAASLQEFGKVVAIDGDTLVAGADGTGDFEAGKFAGAAYVFARQAGGWRQQARLVASDRQAADRFGNAVAIHGGTIAVGAHFSDVNGEGSGAAYIYRLRNGQWRQEAKLVPRGGAAGEEFGNAVAVHGGTVAVGALRGGPGGTAAGAVSIFDSGDGR